MSLTCQSRTRRHFLIDRIEAAYLSHLTPRRSFARPSRAGEVSRQFRLYGHLDRRDFYRWRLIRATINTQSFAMMGDTPTLRQRRGHFFAACLR